MARARCRIAATPFVARVRGRPRGAPSEGTMIMKLITNTQVSVDGVMQANGGNNPVLDPGFDRGGWALPLGDDESTAYIGEFYQRADAFLFGRRTYELFAGYWGVRDRSTTRSRRPELAPEVRRIEHDHRPGVGGHDRALRRSRGGRPRAEGRAGRRAAGARKRPADPLAARTRTRRRDDAGRLPRDRRRRARGCSPTRAWISPSTWWNRAGSRRASLVQTYRPTGRPQYA